MRRGSQQFRDLPSNGVREGACMSGPLSSSAPPHYTHPNTHTPYTHTNTHTHIPQHTHPTHTPTPPHILWKIPWHKCTYVHPHTLNTHTHTQHVVNTSYPMLRETHGEELETAGDTAVPCVERPQRITHTHTHSLPISHTMTVGVEVSQRQTSPWNTCWDLHVLSAVPYTLTHIMQSHSLIYLIQYDRITALNIS